MQISLLSNIVLLSIFAQTISTLPYIFERAVNDTTSLTPNTSTIQNQLGPLLSSGATLYFPGTPQFENATSRWSAYAEPNVAIVVEPAADQDVATTVLLSLHIQLTLSITH